MKLLIQILFLFLNWHTNSVNATPVFAKVFLSSCELSFIKTEIVKEESDVKIGAINYTKSNIESKNQFSSILKEVVWASVTYSEKREEVLQRAGDDLIALLNKQKQRLQNLKTQYGNLDFRWISYANRYEVNPAPLGLVICQTIALR